MNIFKVGPKAKRAHFLSVLRLSKPTLTNTSDDFRRSPVSLYCIRDAPGVSSNIYKKINKKPEKNDQYDPKVSRDFLKDFSHIVSAICIFSQLRD